MTAQIIKGERMEEWSEFEKNGIRFGRSREEYDRIKLENKSKGQRNKKKGQRKRTNKANQ